MIIMFLSNNHVMWKTNDVKDNCAAITLKVGILNITRIETTPQSEMFPILLASELHTSIPFNTRYLFLQKKHGFMLVVI